MLICIILPLCRLLNYILYFFIANFYYISQTLFLFLLKDYKAVTSISSKAEESTGIFNLYLKLLVESI